MNPSTAIDEPSSTPKKAKPQIPQPGQMYAVNQVAYRLQVSDSTVIRMIESGSLPAVCIKSGRRKKIFRIREAALDAWIKSRENSHSPKEKKQ